MKQETQYKPGDKVIYPPANRVMYVQTILPNGKLRCYQIFGFGEKEQAGDYRPEQIIPCPEDCELGYVDDVTIHLHPTKTERFWGIIAVVLIVFVVIPFMIWLDIQSAGGWEKWMNDTDAKYARSLLEFVRFAMRFI